MDGFRTRLTRSIQFRLALTLALVIGLAAAIAGYAAFQGALEEAHELQDDTLQQVAALAAQVYRHPDGLRNRVDDIDDETRLYIQPLGGGGRDRDQDQDRDEDDRPLPLPANLKDGLHTVQLKEGAFRVAVRTVPGGGRLAVAQDIEQRDEIAQSSALHSVLPLLVLVPLLCLLIVLLIRRMFRPVRQLSAEIQTRDGHALHPLPTRKLPTEVQAFVAAINHLLTRIARSVDAQRRFVADAAHELRSPLTALSLQAERLAGTPLPEAARSQLDTLRQGIERNRHLLEQLLGMARAQREHEAPVLQPVALIDVCRQALETQMPLAEARRIDLGVERSIEGMALATEHDLLAILRNLLDNAIRYSPAGGQVNLCSYREAGDVVIEVEDNGPGIPDGERARVLDAFYRVPGTPGTGSGLGLSIVQALVVRLGGSMALMASTAFPHGLLVRIRLPAAPEDGLAGAKHTDVE